MAWMPAELRPDGGLWRAGGLVVVWSCAHVSEMDARVKGGLGILWGGWLVMVVGGGAGRPMRVQRRLSL